MRIEPLNIRNSYFKIELSQRATITVVALGALALLGTGYCLYRVWQNWTQNNLQKRKIEAQNLLETQFASMVRQGNVDLVEKTLREHPELKTFVNGDGNRTPSILNLAIEYLHFDVAACLLEKGANIDVESRDGTAVKVAVCKGNFVGVQWLAENKANLDIGLPLHAAIALRKDHNSFKIIECLINHGACLEFKTLTNSPLYLMAVINLKSHPLETTNTLKLMLSKGAQLTEEEQGSEMAKQIEQIRAEMTQEKEQNEVLALGYNEILTKYSYFTNHSFL